VHVTQHNAQHDIQRPNRGAGMLGPNTTSNQLRPGRSSFEEVAMEARREAAGQLLDVEAPASSASCPQTAPARLLRSEIEPLPGLKGRRNRQQLRRTRRREHEVVDTMISPEEYEALPPSIRYVCCYSYSCLRDDVEVASRLAGWLLP